MNCYVNGPFRNNNNGKSYYVVVIGDMKKAFVLKSMFIESYLATVMSGLNISTGLETNTITTNTNKSTKQTAKTFPTMLKLISGSLTGVNYEDVYMEPDDIFQNNITNENQTANTNKIPTLAETARKVAILENKKLDEKQYIAYEIIACTFLLGLVRDGSDPSTTLYKG